MEVTGDGPLNDGRALRGHRRNEGMRRNKGEVKEEVSPLGLAHSKSKMK